MAGNSQKDLLDNYTTVCVLHDRAAADELEGQLATAGIRFRRTGLSSPAHIGAGEALAHSRFEVLIQDVEIAREIVAVVETTDRDQPRNLATPQRGKSYLRTWAVLLVRLWLGVMGAFLLGALAVGTGLRNPLGLTKYDWMYTGQYMGLALALGGALALIKDRRLRNWLVAAAVAAMLCLALIGVAPNP